MVLLNQPAKITLIIKLFLYLSEKRKIAKDEKLILKKLVEHNTYDEFTSIYVTNVYKKVSDFVQESQLNLIKIF